MIATHNASEGALLDRVVFSVEPKVLAEFRERLDAEPNPNARLCRSLGTAPPWETKARF